MSAELYRLTTLGRGLHRGVIVKFVSGLNGSGRLLAAATRSPSYSLDVTKTTLGESDGCIDNMDGSIDTDGCIDVDSYRRVEGWVEGMVDGNFPEKMEMLAVPAKWHRCSGWWRINSKEIVEQPKIKKRQSSFPPMLV